MTGEFTIALHALIFLAHKGNTQNSTELAKSVCTNPARIRKIMVKLKDAGLVVTREGADGGYFLARAAEAVDLCTVLDAVGERAVPLPWHAGTPCMECLISTGMAGAMEGITGELEEACRTHLSEITVADVSRDIFERR